MPLPFFNVTPSSVQIGELFDTNKKYVYKDPNNGQLTIPARDPIGYGEYYDSRYVVYDEETNYTTWWWTTGVAGLSLGQNTSINAGVYTYYTGSYRTSTYNYVNGEIYAKNYYGIYRIRYTNLNVIRLAKYITIDNYDNNLTYSFDNQTVSINSPVYINTSANIMYIGVI